jgi:ABC-2 type transport system permease protein
VSPALSISMTVAFLVACLAIVWWIFKTGYRLKN